MEIFDLKSIKRYHGTIKRTFYAPIGSEELRLMIKQANEEDAERHAGFVKTIVDAKPIAHLVSADSTYQNYECEVDGIHYRFVIPRDILLHENEPAETLVKWLK